MKLYIAAEEEKRKAPTIREAVRCPNVKGAASRRHEKLVTVIEEESRGTRPVSNGIGTTSPSSRSVSQNELSLSDIEHDPHQEDKELSLDLRERHLKPD